MPNFIDVMDKLEVLHDNITAVRVGLNQLDIIEKKIDTLLWYILSKDKHDDDDD